MSSNGTGTHVKLSSFVDRTGVFDASIPIRHDHSRSVCTTTPGSPWCPGWGPRSGSAGRRGCDECGTASRPWSSAQCFQEDTRTVQET